MDGGGGVFPPPPGGNNPPPAPGGGKKPPAPPPAPKQKGGGGRAPPSREKTRWKKNIIATDYTAKQPPDGYNILMVTTVFAVNPSLLQKLPYDTLANFTPVILAGTAPNVLVTKPSLPVNSVKELIDYAHANPGKLTYGFPGVGTTPHLAVELFNNDANIKAVGVVFRGTQPQLMALMSGDLDYMFDITTSLELVKDGRLKGLAVTSSQRLEKFPEMPTMVEAGLPGYEAYTWYGFVVPTGTPPDVVEQINQGFNKGIQDPVVRTRMDTLGNSPPRRFATRLQPAYPFGNGQVGSRHPQGRHQTGRRSVDDSGPASFDRAR